MLGSSQEEDGSASAAATTVGTFVSGSAVTAAASTNTSGTSTSSNSTTNEIKASDNMTVDAIVCDSSSNSISSSISSGNSSASGSSSSSDSSRAAKVQRVAQHEAPGGAIVVHAPPPPTSSQPAAASAAAGVPVKSCLRELLCHDISPDGHRLLLPYFSTNDLLRLSESARPLQAYRYHLKEIKLAPEDNSLTSSIIKLLTTQAAVYTLILSNEDAVKVFLAALRKGALRSLRKLDLYGNKFDTSRFGIFLAMRTCPNLVDLTLRMSFDELGLGVGGVLVVLSQGHCPLLSRLALHIDKPPKHYLKDYLQTPRASSLRELNLQGCHFQNSSMVAIASGLGSGNCSQLQTLNLSDCSMQGNGAVALGQAICAGSLAGLEHLNLGVNPSMGNVGVLAIAHALAVGGCPKLKKLMLGRVGMRNGGADALVVALSTGYLVGLTDLDLSGNAGMGAEMVGDALVGSLAVYCPNLCRLNVKESGFSPRAIYHLFRTMRSGRVWPGMGFYELSLV